MKLIDSTPIPLGKLCDWAKSNGRIRGLKMHVVFDPKADCPGILDITDANVNDAQIGRTGRIEPGATYVFDKGYCHYGWWTAIADQGAVLEIIRLTYHATIPIFSADLRVRRLWQQKRSIFAIRSFTMTTLLASI